MTVRSVTPLGFALVLIAAGCAKPAAPTAGVTVSVDPSLPIPVNATTIAKRPLNWVIEQPGQIQAFETTPLVAKLPGYVKSVAKDLGDPVTAGEVLATLEIPELEREADQKTAMVAQAKAEADLARKSVDVATEQIAAADAMVVEIAAGLNRATSDYERWESEFKRIEGLVATKVLDAQTLDETRKQFRSASAAKDEASSKVNTAKAAVREATAKKGKADAEVRAADARIGLADADAKRVAALLSYREIRAPFAGVVTGRFVHTGHFLQPNSGARAEPLFTVARLDIVRVFCDVPENSASMANPGAKVVIKVPALANKDFPATVTRTARVLATDSRTLRTEIDLPNATGELRPGMYAVVRILATTPEALVVPTGAVLVADETAYIYAVEDGKVTKLRVQVGRADATGIELLNKRKATVHAGDWQPLTGTEKVVVGNLGALADGQTVSVKE